MDFNTFEQQFVPFCETDGVSSGKAGSYYRAIKYLAEFLNLPDLGHGNASKILEKENDIKDRGSNFYQQLFRHLDDNGRSSYLDGAFLQSAMPYFARFAAEKNLL